MLPTVKKKNDEQVKKEMVDNLLHNEEPKIIGTPGPGTYFNQQDELV